MTAVLSAFPDPVRSTLPNRRGDQVPNLEHLKAAADQVRKVEHLKAADIEPDPDFRDLLLPPSPQEQKQIVDQLFEPGHQTCLDVWLRHGRYILLTGYDRFPTLRLHDLPFTAQVHQLAGRQHATLFILKRRLDVPNLSPLQIGYHYGLSYLAQSQTPGGDRRSPEARQSFLGKTHEALGDHFGVSAATIRRGAELVRAVRKIAASCGFADVIPLLLARKARLSHLAIEQLAAAPPEVLCPLMGELRLTGKLPLHWRRLLPAKARRKAVTADDPVSAAIRAEQLAVARSLLARYGRPWLASFPVAIEELLTQEGAAS
jgi:hypothetical protein